MNSIIIGIIAWWIAEGCGIIQYIKWWLCHKEYYYKVDVFNLKKERRLKPFDCPLCMGWWIGLIATYNQTGNVIHSITIGILSSAVAILVSKLMSKI